MPSKKQPSSRGWIPSAFAAVISMAVALALVANVRLVVDTINYYSYTPDSAIASFAARSDMTNKAKFLFYASRPSLDEAAIFNSNCRDTDSTTAILGCYANQRISIYNVNDTRLRGIRTTTAAHEMLHAAYARLSSSEKSKVNRLLEAEYDKLRTDEELSARMAFYDRTEPGERLNELHSVIGTEIRSIDPELETYYKQYFTDRTKVVALHDAYEAVFTNLQAEADELNGRIAELDAAIRRETEAYNQQAEQLKKAINDFNAKAERGDFSSQSAFSSERRRLVGKVSSLDDLRTKINAMVAEYNRLADELNSIATQTQDLNKSIDSSLAAPPSL